MNIKGAGTEPAVIAADTVARVNATGFSISVAEMDSLASQVGEQSLFGRTGGAATLAVGMAQIFSKVTHGRWLDLWYHFAIMFEALFILTTLDAGTRVGRYLLQDALGHLWKPLGDVKNHSANVLASVLVVAGWGYFLIQGVRDPLGGINSLWPLFGIANQLLASIALCLATTVILKMQLRPPTNDVPSPPGRPALALVILIPLVWLLSVTMTAGWQKVFHADPRIGFLAQAQSLDNKLPALRATVETAKTSSDLALVKAAEKALLSNRILHFNNLLDAVVALSFMVLVTVIVLLCTREWILLLARKRISQLKETDPVWLPDYAVAEGQPLKLFSLLALALALLKELSGEAAIDRVQQHAARCDCLGSETGPARIKIDLLGGGGKPEGMPRSDAYVKASEERFQNITRCC